MKAFKVFITFALSVALFGGCATITDGPKQKVTLVASNEQKIVVTINGEKVTTPIAYDLPRKPTEIHVYAEDNPGYQTSSFNTYVAGMEGNPSTILNAFGLLAFGFPGITSTIVDNAKGSQFRYANERIIIPVYRAAK